MKMNCKKIIGLLGIVLAFGLVFVACDSGSDNNKPNPTPTNPDPNDNGNGNDNGNNGDGNGENVQPDATVNQIEAAFTYMLNDKFVSGSDVTVSTIKKMSNWGQTDSEYGVTGTQGKIRYSLPSSFGTVQVIVSGGAVFMSGPHVSITWESPTGDTSFISGSSSYAFKIASGSDAKTVTYPYTVTYPSGNDQFIKGKLNLKLSK